MTLKTSLAVIALILTPALATAQGCHGDKADKTAMSCKEGSTWDEAKGTCVPQPSS